MVKPYDGRESEHNWADRERAVLRVRGMLKGGVHERFYDTFMSCLQHGFIGLSLKAVRSFSTRPLCHDSSIIYLSSPVCGQQ